MISEREIRGEKDNEGGGRDRATLLSIRRGQRSHTSEGNLGHCDAAQDLASEL